eukprot:scaffold1087_cov136-Cylindrotheca_fusiformis.AAC.7
MKTQVRVSVHKPSTDTKLGIGFCREENEPLKISGIAEGGIVFQQTQLRPGLEVLEINGVDVTEMDPIEAASLLREAPIGQVAFVVEGEELERVRDAVSYQTGLTFREVQGVPGIMIAAIENESMFSYNELQVGSLLQSINVTVKPVSVEGAATALELAGPGKVRVVAERIVHKNLGIWADRSTPREEKKELDLANEDITTLPKDKRPPIGRYPDGSLILEGDEDKKSETAIKRKGDMDMGLSFTQRGKDVIISRVRKGTPFSACALEAGMKLLSIEFGTTPKTAEEAALTLDGLTAVDGVELALDAEAFVGDITKGIFTFSTGITLTDTEDGVVISDIRKGSLFAATDLKVGMKVLAVNGRPCPFSAYQVVDEIKSAKSDVKVVAQFPLSYMKMYKKVKEAQEHAAKYKDGFFLCGDNPMLG